MSLKIRTIRAKDNTIIAKIIKNTGAEFGAVGDGFGPSDEEVSAMSLHYTQEKHSLYLIAEHNGEIVGGCGIAPFNNSATTCELKKLFLTPASRGLGIGKALSMACLEYADNKGFNECYLDTLSSMTSAITLYEKLGFKHLNAPLNGTIHNRCDVWMLKQLSTG